jgi:AcrR family transcriptional regulator
MRDGSETNLRIRRAALALFVARGVGAVSVRDIAEAADIQPATLYVHWKSREALIEDLFSSGFAAYGRRLEAVVTAGGPVAERLAELIRTVCRLHGEDEVLFRFLLLTQHANLPRLMCDMPNPIEMVERLLTEAHGEGLTDGDPKLLTASLVGLVVQAATFHHYGRLARSPASLEAEITRLGLKLVLR